MAVNGKNRRQDLREEKETQRDIQKGSLTNDFFTGNHFYQPTGDDNYGQKINRQHFVEFKKLIVERG